MENTAMEIDEESSGRKRAGDDIWEVRALRASLEDRTSPLMFQPKRLKQTPFVLVKTVSGSTIRVEPFGEHEERLIFIGDIKRCLNDDHGMSVGNTVLLLNRKNVTLLDDLEIESGSTLYAIFRVEGCREAKPGYMERY